MVMTSASKEGRCSTIIRTKDKFGPTEIRPQLFPLISLITLLANKLKPIYFLNVYQFCDQF